MGGCGRRPCFGSRRLFSSGWPHTAGRRCRAERGRTKLSRSSKENCALERPEGYPAGRPSGSVVAHAPVAPPLRAHAMPRAQTPQTPKAQPVTPSIFSRSTLAWPSLRNPLPTQSSSLHPIIVIRIHPPIRFSAKILLLLFSHTRSPSLSSLCALSHLPRRGQSHRRTPSQNQPWLVRLPGNWWLLPNASSSRPVNTPSLRHHCDSS